MRRVYAVPALPSLAHTLQMLLLLQLLLCLTWGLLR
jgi:hypothetical protein